MEKLLNLTSSPIILDRINFSGFSSSKNWIGYFEKSYNGNDSLINESFHLVKSFFQNLDDFIMILSLNFDENDYRILSDKSHYKLLFGDFVKRGVIRVSNEDDLNFYLEQSGLLASRLIIECNKNCFESICSLIMYYGGAIGEVCFLINPKLQIALYPHEDIGFGVISLTEDKSLGIEFLEYCKQFENFRVYIEE